MSELLMAAGIALLVWRVAFLVRDRRFRRGREPAPAAWFDLGMLVALALVLVAIVLPHWLIDPETWEESRSRMPRWVFSAICLLGAVGSLARTRELYLWKRQRVGAVEKESTER